MIRTSFNEVYFSKEPIKYLQDELSTIRLKFKDKPFSPSMNIDKDVLKFNRDIEAFFGYKTYSLNISPDMDLNAYAFPVGVFLDEQEKRKLIAELKATKNGFKHDPKNGAISAVCTLNLGLINYKDITDEEIFAVLLHEIGHTFFEAVTDKDCLFSINTKLIAAIKRTNSIIIKRISSGLEISPAQIKSDISTIVSDLKLKFNKFTIKPHAFIDSLKILKHRFMRESMEDNMRKERYDYTNEKFADTFAASYGYATALHSFLMKVFNEQYDKLAKQKSFPFRFYKLSKYLNNDLKAYILNRMDPHPYSLARIKVSIEYLKKELGRESLDPKLKSQMLEQINELSKLIDDFVSMPDDGNDAFVIREFYTELYKQFGGDRREQDTDNDALFDTIDTRYKDLLKGNK